MAKVTKSSLSEEDRLEAAECILPGISIFLEKLLARERISNELDSIRQCYVEILRSRNSTESAVLVRKKVEALDLKLDSNTKLGKFGRIREKRLINIRQFNLKHNQRKQELKSKIGLMNDNSQLETYINKKNLHLSTSRSRHCAREDAGQMNIMMSTDDERHGMTATDDERRLSAASENFVELSKSQVDLTSKNLSKLGDTSLNQGHLYHKENEVIRQRWLVLDANVLRCYKRQNGAMLFELDFTEGSYSAMQGRIGKMFAIRLSGSKTVTSHLFASPKVETIASWIMSFSRAGVRLQDDLLREISPTEQNNNKVNSSYKERNFSDKDDFSTNLLDAIEFFDRRQNGCILPKRSSCSFKELEVLRKLKLSLTAKKNESRLDRRKTWSAGTFPVSPVAMFDTVQK
ncbi:uncharacterized protein LOC124444106 isoform X2 [Xenia sp. Carnegie-2017]|uniref:uncharacterized protein LOC124444106 isoform X2 n=1 Tax=Xenia sp. Carnegie-2017 TaxID=2897299 RepID=UPI001F03E567|nr:uncharacterized protein LOC124444106 isoform X2 [Xenia sp. Carnegie-2017]